MNYEYSKLIGVSVDKSNAKNKFPLRDTTFKKK